MRIALVTSSFLPTIGGAEFGVHHLAQQWRKQGHDVCVINATADRATHPEALYSVRKLGLLRGTTRFGAHRWPFLQHATRGLQRCLREYRPDFISGHFGYPTGIWLSRLKPLPHYLITCRGPALNETPQGPRQRFGIDNLVAEALNRSAGAVAMSSDARRIMERIGVAPANILDIPNGVELTRFQTKVVGFDLRRMLGIPGDALVILSVGRSIWAKAYDTGIKTVAKVLARQPGIYYVLLGKGTGEWLPLARELGVAENIAFCEGLYGDELIGAYQQADIFFLPSVKELCPMVLPESMGAGLPAVVTNISGSQDMVQTGENGFVLEPGDAEGMAEALLQLVQDEPLRERMRQTALEKSKLYSWDRISRLYLEHAHPERTLGG